MSTKQISSPAFKLKIASAKDEEVNRIEVMNYPIFADNLDKLDLSKRTVINTINQYSFCIAEEDEDFKNALKESDVLLPDGVGIIMAAKMLIKKRIKKIAGADMHQYLLEHLNKTNGSCFYLGASQETLDKIRTRISKEYKHISFGCYSPPYKTNFSEGDIDEMIGAVNAFSPDVLFVGMTAPKQEKWATMYKYQLNAQVICSIGAVFDFYAGTIDRPDKFWINLGLEWFIRMVKEPKRMWKRYLVYGPLFVYHILKEKFSAPKVAGNLGKDSTFLYKL
jgi:N-acetylglucosaminyldiphosphoundecaprenol N-acetyl-beta-D-mannosaminyltransferase